MISKLGNLCQFLNGGTPSKDVSRYFEGHIPWITSADISGPIVNTARSFISEEAIDNSATNKVAKGTVLLVTRTGVGKVTIAGMELCFSQDITAIQPDSSKLDPAYLVHFLVTKQKYFERLARGATIKGITRNVVTELEIPLPPLSEQRRIAAILDQADALRARRREALAQLDTLTQSIFIEMFGDPVSNPLGNKVVRLSEIATRITDGVHQKPNYTDDGIPFISVKNITTGVLLFDDCKFVSLEDHEKFTKRCKAEYLDILYTKVGATYGRPAIVNTDQEFSIYVSVCLIKPDKKLVDPFFLNAALGTTAIKKQADNRIKGIGVPDLHLDQIQNFLIPLPIMDKQKEFAERVAAVEEMKTKHRLSLAEFDILFASLQHRAFLGEL